MPPQTVKKKKETAQQRETRFAMEAEAAKEAERHRAELARVKLREARAREEAAARINSHSMAAKLLQRMREAKMETLRSEVSALARQHDWDCDRRDRHIENLLEDLKECSQQRVESVDAHGEVVRRLLQLHQERVADEQQRLHEHLQEMRQRFESERVELQASHNRRKKELADTAQALEVAYAEALGTAASGYGSVQEGLRSQAAEGYNVLKLSLEQRIAELEAQVEAQHAAHLDATCDTHAAYQELANTDAEVAEAIKLRTARLHELHAQLTCWRGAIMANSEEWRRRNAALASEKEAVLARHMELKAALARHRRRHQESLRAMCASAGHAHRSLNVCLEAAQRVLQLAELCRRLETPRDRQSARVAAEPATMEASAAVDSTSGACNKSEGEERLSSTSGSCWDTDSDAASGLEVLDLNDNSHRMLSTLAVRINRAKLDSATLEQQKQLLATENAALRGALDSMEAGRGVRPDAVDSPLNSLLVVNFALHDALRRGCAS